MTLELLAKERTEKVEKLRKEGLIPAVLYGPKTKPRNIEIEIGIFSKLFREAGESTVVTLDIDGDKIDTLIHDVQYHPVTGNIVHIDFYVFDKDKKVEVEVPLEFTGESPAIKTLGGILVKVLYEVMVEALPKDLPHNIEVDISSLVDFESQIKVSDLKLPVGVKLVTEEGHDEVVALVDEPREEEPEEAPVDLSAIEIEQKGKKEEEGEEGSETNPTPEKKEE